MRKFIAVCLLLSSIPALAAQPPDGADWSGPYAGVRLAEGWGDAHLGTGHYDPAFPFAPTSVHLRGAGAGVSMGYDWQRENLIYGLGVDVLGTHIAGTRSLYTNPLPGLVNGCDSARANCPMHVKQRVENLATLRLKGGRAYDRFAVYGTAGVAVGEVRRDMYEAIQYWGPTGNWGSDRRLATGWPAGAGTLYALTDKLQLQADYLYVDLGKKDYRFTDTPTFVYEQNAAVRFSLLSLGLNY